VPRIVLGVKNNSLLKNTHDDRTWYISMALSSTITYVSTFVDKFHENVHSLQAHDKFFGQPCAPKDQIM
jgi:hypothetical protein